MRRCLEKSSIVQERRCRRAIRNDDGTPPPSVGRCTFDTSILPCGREFGNGSGAGGCSGRGQHDPELCSSGLCGAMHPMLFLFQDVLCNGITTNLVTWTGPPSGNWNGDADWDGGGSVTGIVTNGPQLDCLDHLLQRDSGLHSEMAIEDWPRDSRPCMCEGTSATEP